MDDSKKIEIINKAISICENQVSFENTKIKDYRHARGICFCVKNHEKYYDPLVGTIFRELKLGKNFSSGYVRKFIDILISDILKKGAEHIRIDPLSIDSFKDEFQDVIVSI